MPADRWNRALSDLLVFGAWLVCALAAVAALRQAGAAPPPPAPKSPARPPGTTPGDRVSHKKFGQGTVSKTAGEGETTKLTVQFDDPTVGEKVLLARFLAPMGP